MEEIQTKSDGTLIMFNFINRIADGILALVNIPKVDRSTYLKSQLSWPHVNREKITVYKEEGGKIIRLTIEKYPHRKTISKKDVIEKDHPDYVKIKSEMDTLSSDMDKLTNDTLHDDEINELFKDIDKQVSDIVNK